MKIIKLFILLCLFFSLKPFAGETGLPADLPQGKTTADFIPECLNCETRNEIYPLFERETLDCLKTVYSEKCEDIPQEERRNCAKTDTLQFSDTNSFLLNCAKETALSFEFVFDLLLYGITASTEWLFESKQNSSSAENYVLIEFYKAYLTSQGSKMERYLKSAEIVGKQTFQLIWSNVWEFLQTEYKKLKCYNAPTQATLACVFIAGLFVPIPGASFINTLKIGAKTGSKIIKQPQSSLKALTKMTQLKTVTSHIRSNFNNIKANVLKKAEKLTKIQKSQIQQFFKNVDKEKFINSISRQLSQTRNSSLSKADIKKAVISSLTVGTAYTIQLSPKSAIAITEGVIDTLSIEYIYKEVL